MAKILVVDRDRQIAKRMVDTLRQAGHACAVCHRGKDALDIIAQEQLDLLLLDTMLPDISGFEVCRRIRRSSELFHLPIVFVSEMSSPEEIQHSLAQGADDFIVKPVEPTQIAQRVNSLLQTGAQAGRTDPVTGLPDADETRRRIQLRITRSDRFALIYVELLGLRQLIAEAGAEGRDKVLRHLGRALRISAEGLPNADVFLGHMGGGFFLCMLAPDEAESFGNRLLKSWRRHLPTLRESLGLGAESSAGPGVYLDLMICTTAREGRDSCSAQDLLDTLSRIRRSVQDDVGGIHLDRRHWNNPSGTDAGPPGV